MIGHTQLVRGEEFRREPDRKYVIESGWSASRDDEIEAERAVPTMHYLTFRVEIRVRPLCSKGRTQSAFFQCLGCQWASE